MEGLKVLKGNPFVKRPELPPGRKNSNARMRLAEKRFARRVIAGGAMHMNCRNSTAQRRKIFRYLKRLKEEQGKQKVGFFRSLFNWAFTFRRAA